MHGIYNNRGENPISSVHPYPLILDLILDRGNNIWRRKRRDLLAFCCIVGTQETVGYSRTRIFDGVIIIREAPLIRSSPDRLLTFDPSDEVWGK